MVAILTMKQEWMWERVDNVDIFFGQHIVCIIFWPKLWLLKTLEALTGLCWLINSALHRYKGQKDPHCGTQWITSTPSTCGCNYHFVNIFIESGSTKFCRFFLAKSNSSWNDSLISKTHRTQVPLRVYVCNIKNKKMITLETLNVNSLRQPPVTLVKVIWVLQY